MSYLIYRIISDVQAERLFRMGLEYFTIGSTPNNEECLQVGMANSDEMKKECGVYCDQLARLNPNLPTGCEFFILKSTGHDFGYYYEAAFMFPVKDIEGFDPYKLGCGCDNWDDISLKALKVNNYSLLNQLI